MRISSKTYHDKFHRFTFQGQEKDDEVKGDGNSVNYKYRMYDPRVGRFFAVDPVERNYPWNSTYAFSENRVIDGVELEGKEWDLIQINDGKVVAIEVTMNFEINSVPEGYSVEDYKIEIQSQFNRVIQKSSGGHIKGIVKFDNSVSEESTGRMVPRLLLTNEPAKCLGPYEVGASTTWNLMNAPLQNSAGEAKTPSEVGNSIAHELLHTLKLPHPFEDGSIEDTQLEYFGNSQYGTVEVTAPNMKYNQMMYNYMTVDGNGVENSENGQITQGQLDFIINEILKQKDGAGAGGMNTKSKYYEGEGN